MTKSSASFRATTSVKQWRVYYALVGHAVVPPTITAPTAPDSDFRYYQAVRGAVANLFHVTGSYNPLITW